MSKPRILVVEDEPSISSYFKTALWSDFEVEIAETMADAMTRLADNSIPIRCVTLDLHMPDGFGLPLIKKIKENYASIPIVVITGFDYTQLDVVAAGAYAIIKKPETGSSVLISTIQSAIASAG